MASSAGVSTVLFGFFVLDQRVARCALLVPFVRLSSRSGRSGRQGPGCSLSTLGTRLDDAASCGRCREERLP